MQNTIIQYITELNRQYQPVAREHTYRPALQRLLATMLPHLTVSNELARLDCGAPDLILLRKEDKIPIAYVETKNLNDTDLWGNKKNKEQFDRYKRALDHIIFTDYLEFHRYEKEKGEIVESVRIAELESGKIKPLKENFAQFENIVRHFGKAPPQTIVSAALLAEIMASKARLMADITEKILSKDSENGSLAELMAAFKDILIHDITPKKFADVYAQTIAYGMFAARLHSDTPKHFNREDVARLIPKTNPFLRQLFHQIAGLELDNRISWVVDDLAEIFRVADMQAAMQDFGKRTRQNDPMIHFYENFLTKYDPKERVDCGVYYTPPAVVNFIVRAVDEILQRTFNLPKGLADSSKVNIKQSPPTIDKRDKVRHDEEKVHKVQILDPAAGTGAFLVETVNQIHKKIQRGMWQEYVKEHLIPRLNGFELLMASYALAHLNLDWILKQKGYESTGNQRFQIYLTNSLEKQHPDTGTFWGNCIAQEANAANNVKGNTPVMVVMGNPPYSGESQNRGMMDERINEYKKEPSGIRLQEKNFKWLNDDYVKFIRYGQDFIEKNGEGILAFINNHSFLDNPTFRGMRWNLLQNFDKIYILDLHGNSKKKETAPDGSQDENVFDIQQGVSINIFVKTGQKKANDLAQIFHCDLYGKRTDKYGFLRKNRLQSVKWKKLKPAAPYYFFVAKDFSLQKEYEKGFGVQELFPVNGVGMTTAHDEFVIGDKDILIKRFEQFKLSRPIPEELHKKFNVKEKKGWNILAGWRNLQHSPDVFDYIKSLSYRPFDDRHIFYEDNLVWRCVWKIMQHFLKGENTGLVIGRQGHVVGGMPWNLVFVTQKMIDINMYYRGGGMVFPLYLYLNSDKLLANEKRKPNLNAVIVTEIAQRTGLRFTAEKETAKNTFAPLDILDYIYAVLHSPAYRERYKEFLKIDFPRVPYPRDIQQFRKLVKLGEKLRRLHLMDGVKPRQRLAKYDKTGNDAVEKTEYKNGQIWINATQFFDNVPSDVWNFYIGGYQPAQKWLKDRKGRTLNYDDIEHYQKIICVLKETGELMCAVDACMVF